LSAIKVVQAKEKGFIYDLQTKPFSLFDKGDFFSALLSGGVASDRAKRWSEAGVVVS
jgi:hypothetical protein